MQIATRENRLIANWLITILILIFIMVVLGGITRLTGSGLSMVTWHPVFGVLPPLTTEHWNEVFGRYQLTPEFLKINSDMNLNEFKSIFWFEYTHRLLGRIIGLAFFVPFVIFWWRKLISPELVPKMIVIFILGGFQGVLGWYMVKSGLVDIPHVSQYRLVAHLISAVAIYSFILWTVLDLRHRFNYLAIEQSTIRRWRLFSLYLMLLIVITIVSGGFVAGLKAGLIFNTFPLMAGQWVPEGIAAMSPWYLNLVENMVTVQFQHRVLAITSGLVLCVWYIRGRLFFKDPAIQFGFKLVGMMIIIQLALGVGTLLMQVPVWLGAMHQAGAILVLTALIINVHALSRH